MNLVINKYRLEGNISKCMMHINGLPSGIVSTNLGNGKYRVLMRFSNEAKKNLPVVVTEQGDAPINYKKPNADSYVVFGLSKEDANRLMFERLLTNMAGAMSKNEEVWIVVQDKNIDTLIIKSNKNEDEN